MGMNLISGCHKCRVQKFHFRGEENETIMPFYQSHAECMREYPHNVETKEQTLQAAEWMEEYKEVK